MIIEQRILDFEKLGFGLFVHFGLYSCMEEGEWSRRLLYSDNGEYEAWKDRFCPALDWAARLAAAAKAAGCKYITLTTRHHDGYSLYDTCGLNSYDAPHSCGRDLVREFVDACRAEEIIPFFYHTLIDWHEPTCPFTAQLPTQNSREGDWAAYMAYLQRSVELLCTNYGTIGGIWFDGMWAYWDNDWQEDALYGMIRRHQPQAIIINNTGLDKLGQLGHIQLDSVTFERGKPLPLNLAGSPKYIASEMCESFNAHWGYAADDLRYKSPTELIETLADCRRHGSNLLLNVGIMGNGYIPPVEAAMLGVVGHWMERHSDAIRAPRPTGISVEGKPGDFILSDGSSYYLFCKDLPISGDGNVSMNDKVPLDGSNFESHFSLPCRVQQAIWMDNGKPVPFTQTGSHVTVQTQPFDYGRSWVVRVARLICE